MHLFTTVFACLAALSTMPAQCCLGAYHLRSTIEGGNFRVEARVISKLYGHGPYHYRFELFEREVDDKWVPRGHFDKKFDTQAHFRIEVVPSETGNGIWLRGPDRGDDGGYLDFYDMEGRRLARVQVHQHNLRGKKSVWSTPDKQTGRPSLLSVSHARGGIVEFMLPMPTEEAHRRGIPWADRWGRLYAPLGLDVTSPESRREDDERLAWFARMLIWTPKVGKQQESAVRTHLFALQGAGHKKAMQALVDMGLSTLPLVDAALKSEDYDATKGASRRLREVRDQIWTRLYGHRAPQDNLILLAGILNIGDRRLEMHARSRLRAILPKGTPVDGKWIYEHHRELAKAMAAGHDKTARANKSVPVPDSGSKLAEAPKRSLKGWELYVWQRDGATYYSLMLGTNAIKTEKAITKASVRTFKELKDKFGQLRKGEFVMIHGPRLAAKPPSKPAKAVRDYGKKIGLRIQ